MGVPVIVVTHEVPDGWPRANSTVSFNTDGVEAALAEAKRIAGGKYIDIGSPNITQQLLNKGLLDEIRVKLVSIFVGNGTRFFENLENTPAELEGPQVTQGNGVVRLHYRIPTAQ